jgi:hypothetical protein
VAFVGGKMLFHRKTASICEYLAPFIITENANHLVFSIFSVRSSQERERLSNDPSVFAMGALEGDGWMTSSNSIRYFHPKIEQKNLTTLKLAAFLNFFLRQ